MFDDDIDIDFDEILNYSQPSSPVLKRTNSQTSQEQLPKKPKTEDEGVLSLTSNAILKEPEKNFNTTSTLQKNDEIATSSSCISIQKSNSVNSEMDTNENTNDKVPTFTATNSKRKFPGPAGLLPERNSSFNEQNSNRRDNLSAKEDQICSQTFLFNDNPWNKMMEDFRPTFHSSVCLPNKYDIEWIKSRVMLKKLINQKAPFLAAYVHSISAPSIHTPIVNLTIKDRSGTIQGTMVHNLYEEYSNNLIVGSVIVLKEIGVLTAGSNEPYLTITQNNLISIYTKTKFEKNNPTQKLKDLTKISIQNISANELIQKINELKQLNKNINSNLKLPSAILHRETNICENFKRTILNANLKKEETVLKPNLNKLKSNSPTSNNNNSDLKLKDTVPNKFNISKDSKENTDIMKFFDSQEDIDDFFKEEPNFCSTQMNENEENKKESDKSSLEENKQIWDLFEGVDANSLFDEF